MYLILYITTRGKAKDEGQLMRCCEYVNMEAGLVLQSYIILHPPHIVLQAPGACVRTLLESMEPCSQAWARPRKILEGQSPFHISGLSA